MLWSKNYFFLNFNFIYMEDASKARKEVAAAYGISPRTLCRWIKKACITITSGLLTIKEVQMIYDAFGEPKKK